MNTKAANLGTKKSERRGTDLFFTFLISKMSTVFVLPILHKKPVPLFEVEFSDCIIQVLSFEIDQLQNEQLESFNRGLDVEQSLSVAHCEEKSANRQRTTVF